MKRIKEKAIANHKKGYNCAQSVACLYAEELGFDERDVFRMTEAFGLGMGVMDTCGAVSAMAVVAGMKNSDGNSENPTTKSSTYKLIRAMFEEFKKKNQSTDCRELKGVDTKKPLRSCNDCIEDSVEIIEKFLLKR